MQRPLRERCGCSERSEDSEADRRVSGHSCKTLQILVGIWFSSKSRGKTPKGS